MDSAERRPVAGDDAKEGTLAPTIDTDSRDPVCDRGLIQDSHGGLAEYLAIVRPLRRVRDISDRQREVPFSSECSASKYTTWNRPSLHDQFAELARRVQFFRATRRHGSSGDAAYMLILHLLHVAPLGVIRLG
jgi:hypothetical protein